MNSTVDVGCGSKFAGLLTLLFVGLKLTGHIDWSWWWVLSPIWISVGLFLLCLIMLALLYATADKKRR